MAKEALDTLASQKANIGRLKFTSADGREVDIKQLRGKVVLVDSGPPGAARALASCERHRELPEIP